MLRSMNYKRASDAPGSSASSEVPNLFLVFGAVLKSRDSTRRLRGSHAADYCPR